MKVFAVLLFAMIATTSLPSAHARPLYMRGFAEEYPKIETLTRAAKCQVCHCTEQKRAINEYGQALAKALKEKNVKDKKKMEEAIVKIESEKSKVPKEPGSKEMKTFGELIKEGKLPGTNEEEKK